MTPSDPSPDNGGTSFPSKGVPAWPAESSSFSAGQPPIVQPWQMTYAPMPLGPPGKLRGTGFGICMSLITLGIYQIYWYYQVHDEMKRHSNEGLGGGIALVLAIFAGIVMPYLTASEVGHLYERRGQRRPVSGATGLWVFPGIFLIVGPLVWFVKTNGALNNYWRSTQVR